MQNPIRYCPAGIPVHIIQRGNDRIDCFRSDKDRGVYMKYLRKAASKYKVNIHAWVLMSNHVHLLATPGRDNSTSRMMQYVGRFYVRYFNKRYDRTGTLWEGRFRSCLVQSERYFLTCQKYIELNPVRAGMVENPADFHWSSHRFNTRIVTSSFCVPHEVYLAMGSTESDRVVAYRELFLETLSAEQLKSIRDATNKELVFGSEGFKNQIERRSGLLSRPSKRGPKSHGNSFYSE